MPSLPPTTKRLIVAALTTAALTAALTSCSSNARPTAATTVSPSLTPSGPTAPPTAPTSVRPTAPAPFVAPATINQRDATAVSRAALTIMWSVDSIRDHAGQRDAYLRASVYFTRDYATRIRRTFAPQRLPGLWEQHKAFNAVEVKAIEDEDQASDTPTHAGRQWSLTITPTGRDGWTGETFTVLAFTELVRADNRHPWRLTNVVVS